ncbi:MAG TPA: four-helix bundle copper-binding protein [Planosporangium sp.]|jgi:hypothetical protein|nr:four-helix bundle copper-binding protein [Planosporangium sp.]
MSATTVAQILDSHPGRFEGADREALSRCVEACGTCAQVCAACADACLSEPRADELVANVRSSLDCADLCTATSRVLSRDTGARVDLVVALLQACAVACRACRTACESASGGAGQERAHADACQLACARCADACEEMLNHMRVS